MKKELLFEKGEWEVFWIFGLVFMLGVVGFFSFFAVSYCVDHNVIDPFLRILYIAGAVLLGAAISFGAMIMMWMLAKGTAENLRR